MIFIYKKFSAYIQLTLAGKYDRGYLFKFVASLYINCPI